MKTGLSTCGKTVDEGFFAECAEAGIALVELSMRDETIRETDFEEIARLAGKYGVGLWSFHLPFLPFAQIDISSADENVRSATAEYFAGLIGRINGICGVRYFIVHPSGEPIADCDRRERMAQAKKSLAFLAEKAAEYGAVICVEDLPRTCLGRDSSEIAELAGADERLRICFDTNHLLTEKNTDFIKKCAAKIVTTHVSDYDFTNEKHWLPGEGDVDWRELYDCLTACGYDGPWLYELGYAPPKTMDRRILTAADFVRNAKEIAEGGEITVIGRRISE